MKIESHEARVIEECDLLTASIARLHGFLSSQVFSNLPMWERDVLWKQHAAMTEHRKCLLVRIDAWIRAKAPGVGL